jgi:hypothetical protein
MVTPTKGKGSACEEGFHIDPERVIVSRKQRTIGEVAAVDITIYDA